jgi:hypothetical protein
MESHSLKLLKVRRFSHSVSGGRGQLKVNFIVHNFASTSHFRRRQIVLAGTRKKSTVKKLMKQRRRAEQADYIDFAIFES